MADTTYAKRECPITKDHFRAAASPLKAVVDGSELVLEVKEFSTGSVGWSHSGKVKVRIGGVDVMCQLGLNLTVIGSKGLTA